MVPKTPRGVRRRFHHTPTRSNYIRFPLHLSGLFSLPTHGQSHPCTKLPITDEHNPTVAFQTNDTAARLDQRAEEALTTHHLSAFFDLVKRERDNPLTTEECGCDENGASSKSPPFMHFTRMFVPSHLPQAAYSLQHSSCATLTYQSTTPSTSRRGDGRGEKRLIAPTPYLACNTSTSAPEISFICESSSTIRCTEWDMTRELLTIIYRCVVLFLRS